MTHRSLQPARVAPFALVLSIGLIGQPAFAQQPWMNTALSPAERTELLLEAMTIDQKIAQMQTIPSPNEELEGCGFQRLGRHVEGIPELAIPTLRAVNGGNGIRGGDCVPEPTATALPSATLGAATFSRAINFAWGTVLGQEARDFAHHVLLGPGLNLIRHPYTGRGQEYMSEDPYLAGTIATQQVLGIQSRGTQAMIKHFVTNDDEGGQLERWTKGTRVPPRAMHELYLLPFEMAITTGDAASVMCAFPRLNGDWACENQELLVKTLRERWGFEGYVESDRRAVHSTTGSILAGLSIELDSEPGFYATDKVRAALAAGEIAERDIDQVLRGRYLKMFAFGFFDEPRDRFLPSDLDAHSVVARRAAEQGVVLLKNQQSILPLQSGVTSIALIGAQWFAGMATIPPRNGNPAELTTVIPASTVSPRQGLQNTLAALGSAATVTYNNGADIGGAVALAQQSDVAIVMVGTTPRETRDLPSLSLPIVPATDPPLDEHARCDAEEEEEGNACPATPTVVTTDQDALVAAIAAANPRTIVVLKTSGMVLMPWLDAVPAVLEAWFPGQHDGDAVADILFGVISPSGKLPVTFGSTAREAAFATEAQYPGDREANGLPGGPGPSGSGQPQLVGHYTEDLEMGYRWYEANSVAPLFPFGFGLSYTTFAYSDLAVMSDFDERSGRALLTVTYTITNTGSRPGAEASQVYLTLPGEAREPSKRLVGFQKVTLEPGESRQVTVTLDESAPNHPLSYFEPDPNGTWADGVWVTGSGSYTVHVGTSSADTPLVQTVDLSFPSTRTTLLIDTPNEESHWGIGTTQRLAWSYSGNAATFQIDVSRDEGATWNPVGFVNNRPGDSQSFYWTVQGPTTSTARLRVSAFGEPDATDVNDADIRIEAPTIEILGPAGPVASGSQTTIFYSHNLGANAPVVIEVTTDEGETWAPLARTVTLGATTSSFAWSVDVGPAPRARVRVRALDGSGVQGSSSPFAVTTGSTSGQSAHVFVGAQGRLVYLPYENGDRIPDFSFAGYGGGGVALPTIATTVTVSPTEGDDGANIQAAIDTVSALQADAGGFRGAVLLTAGTYQVAGELAIRTSGVVLRGQGDDADGTIIRAVGKNRRVLITVSGVADRAEVAGTRQLITDDYVPVGVFTLTVQDASGFTVGDDVLVARTPNRAWIDAVGMDSCSTRGTAYDTSDVSGRTCLGGPGVEPWTPESRVIRYERRIAAIDGRRITLDAPMVEAIQKEFGGGYVARYVFPGRIQKVGIEQLRAESDFASDTDEQHATWMLRLANVQDAWVRNVTSRFFVQGTLAVVGGGKYVTVQDSASLDPKSPITGGRRYAFAIGRAAFVLVMRAVSRNGRHDYVTGANTPGPNVFLDDIALRSHSELGPHQRWATGTLFDEVRHESVGRDEIIGVYNRGNSGTGHGWDGAYNVFWNCVGDTHRVSSPPYARNWSIGCQARRRQGSGEFESFDEPVVPASLYLRQLRDRLGDGALVNIGYALGDTEPTTALRP